MKPDGGTMETTEPTEAVAVGEPASSQENLTQQLQPQSQEFADTETSGAVAPDVNGRPVAEVKPKTVDFKAHHKGRPAGGAVMSSPRPGTSSSRMANNSASQNATSTAAGRRVPVAKASGAVPKRPAAAASTSRNPSREPTKTSAGPVRTTSAAPAMATNNGGRPAATSNSVQKRTAPETVNGARPKTTLPASRTMASTTSKSTASTSTKVGAAAAKTTRPAAGPPATRPNFTTSRPTATARPPPAGAKSSSTSSAAKTAASRVTTAPSAGRPAAAQFPKSAAPSAKKDVSRPPSTTATRKPTLATASATTKKPDPSKLAATVKLNSTSKQSTTAAADTKVSQLKQQQPTRSPATKKAVGEARSTAANNSTVRTPPVSPATRAGVSNLVKSKYGKPTQNVSPFTVNKKTEVSKMKTGTGAQRAPVAKRPAGPKTVVAAASVKAVAEVVPQAEFQISSVPVEVPTSDPTVQAAPAPQEVTSNQEVASLPQPSHISIDPPKEQPENSCSLQLVQEEILAPSQPSVPPVAHSPVSSKETTNLSAEETTSASAAPPTTASANSLMVSSTNLNEEEDEEEREASQLVSVSEMSGTTQPTEESRPESAGLAAGSAWKASGALLSELDSEEVSGSQQGASELSAPGVLEGTESMDDLGDGSLKGAIDMEGASAGSPDFEKVPDIPVNDFDEDEDEDDSDRVCDMDVGSERTDELPRPRHDNDVDDEDDDDVEMASEGVTESGLESYGNADEDDFAEDERLDNLNRMAQPPPPPVLPSAPAAQWDQPNPFADPWAEPLQPEQAAEVSPLADAWQLDSETPTQAPVQAWLELGSDPLVHGNQEVPDYFSVKDQQKNSEAQMYAELSGAAREQNLMPEMSQGSTLGCETSTPEEAGDYNREGKLQPHSVQATPQSPQPQLHDQDLDVHTEKRKEIDPEAPSVSADEVFEGTTVAPASNPSSSSVTEDEASDIEGEAQLEELLVAPVVCNSTFDCSAPAQRCLSTVEEGEEVEVSFNSAPAEDATPPSATSMASYGFDTMTTTSNAQSTGESCIKSPGIFSLEELSEEVKEPHAQPCMSEQQYIKLGKEDMESAAHGSEEALESEEGTNLHPAESTLPQQEKNSDDVQPPYYSGICEKTEDSLAGLSVLPLPHRRDHAAYPRTYCDIVKQHGAAAVPPKLTCADLPPRSPAQQALSPQLRRLEQHQRQLQEMQQRRAQQSRPLEEAEQERKRREEEEQRRKKEEAEEEIKRNKEEEERRKREEEQERMQRKDLELQLQQQQEELKQRQQIMQWQQELLQTQGQAVVLSPSSGLCTIYEALENSDEEEAEGEVDGINELKHKKKQESKGNTHQSGTAESAKTMTGDDQTSLSDSPPLTDSLQSSSPSPHPPESPDRPPPLDLDWGKKVDIVQQLINQTLLLNGDSCSSLLLLPGGAGGTLSPLESSLWPSLLPPLTPPSATVTSVSSFSPEATGSSPQGEWTVVELETHH